MASSKREEERNEKIIRGLMKLPPNRRCINCNSLGPQYVCTNFWTFVCMICSGIHREFTHRVKSVSMSKFTSQEVEALQNGGNQRAREIYLKGWDSQRQRFPNSSDAEKVREFIKAVYVSRKYAGGNNSETPLKDSETERNAVEDTRRASSYHSYSQSPPYDFQYEDRLNRKQGSSLSRKPGSDHGLYARKAASFVYSPGRFSDNLSEDRFANEGSSSRVSDYSVSSGGEPFRSAPQSPNLQRDDEFSSPTFYSSNELVNGLEHQRSNSSSEVFAKKDADKVPVPRPQRTVSAGSFGLFHKNSGSLQSAGPATSTDVPAEHHQSIVSTQSKISSILPRTQLPTQSSGGSNNFIDPAIDLFQAPTAAAAAAAAAAVASVDLSQSPGVSTIPFQTTPSSSLSFFSGTSQNTAATYSNPKLPEQSEEANDGWATFDLPQHVKPTTNELHTEVSGAQSKDGSSFKTIDSVSSSNNGLQWLDFQSTNVHEPGPLISSPWTEDLQSSHVAANMASIQPWNAFGETDGDQQQHVEVQGTHSQISIDDRSSTPILFAEDSTTHGIQKHTSTEGFSFPNLSSHFASALPFSQPVHPFMNDVAPVEQKSSNPFDVAFDSEFESSNAFLDMNSLHTALPIRTLPAPYAIGLNDSWFPDFSPNPMGSQGGMSYAAVQPQSSQLQNVPTHGPAASVGGNPFA
ncbi:putative ADP-ribosylation factor GTPase-activating protein AGD14 isoform X2 [Silene latifolia]|uniref:putative ADP-ribosylation factor GTPase-activating protein AGD14 isoform X2 n=1 Tax=Silene latifolia TaxID=37657 RepID=UPI003D77C2B0